MAYLGNVPARSFISFERQVFTIVNSQTAYTLSHSVTNENDIRLVINNIVQEPGSGKAYTASGTTLTLSAALVNGTDEMYCVFLGRAVGTVNAPAGSVTTSQIVDLNVTTGKIAADAVNGDKIADDSISDEHLDPTAITGQTAETSIATDDLILLSDTSASGALRKMTRANFVSGVGGDLTPSWQARLPNTQSFAGDTDTKINFSTEVWDTDSAYDTSNKRFTVPSGEGGKYMYYTTINHTYGESRKITLKLYKNGSKFHQSDRQTDSRGFTWVNFIDLSAGDYIEMYYYLHENPVSGVIDSGTDQSFFGGFKLLGV
jgi:hypothetical protein